MLRLLFYLIIVCFLGWIVAMVTNQAGDLILTFGQTRIATPLPIAIVGAVIAVIVIYLIFGCIKYVVTAPVMMKKRRKARRERQESQAIGQGLIAILSGDVETARRLLKKVKSVEDENNRPLYQVLEARTLALEKDPKATILRYEAMRRDPRTQLAGLFGLFHEASQSGAHEAAVQYAQEASKINLTLDWANQAVLDKLSANGQWNDAIAFFDRVEKSLPRDKRHSVMRNQQRALLYAGKALSSFANHPDEARNFALKAQKLHPDSIPIANVAANILFKLGEARKASKRIETLWSTKPHRDLAQTYLHGASNQTAAMRLKRAKTLASRNPQHFESLMCLAQAAFDAGELTLARKNLNQAMAQEKMESCFLLLADIEQAATGDQGKVRNWLSCALKAPLDPCWMADHVILSEWAPVSPISGKLGAVEWKVPARQYAGKIVEESHPLTPPIKQRNQAIRSQSDRMQSNSTYQLDPAPNHTKPFLVDAIAEDHDNDYPVDRLIVDDPGVERDKDAN